MMNVFINGQLIQSITTISNMQNSDTLKIYDKFYLGDQISARDQQFILKNQISFIVNLTNKYIPNYYQHYSDIIYCNLTWPLDEEQLAELYDELVRRTNRYEVVLIHGEDHLEQPCIVMTIFLMHRFRWSLFKSLEFMQSRVENMSVSQNSYALLKELEMELLKEGIRLSYNWDIKGQGEEEIIRNTFVNGIRGKTELKKNNNGFKSSRVEKSRKNKQNKKRVTFNLQPTEGDNNRSLARNESKLTSHTSSQMIDPPNTQTAIKNKIIQSVRKILTQNTKQPQKKQNLQLQNKNQKKSSVSKSITSLTKQKSSYTLESLPSASLERIESNQPISLTRITSSHSVSLAPSKQKQTPQPSFPQTKQKRQNEQQTQIRLQTQQLHPNDSSLNNSSLMLTNKKLKTQGQDFSKPVIDVRLPKNNVTTLNNFSSSSNLISLKKHKQNVPPKYRKPTPSKVAQIFSRK